MTTTKLNSSATLEPTIDNEQSLGNTKLLKRASETQLFFLKKRLPTSNVKTLLEKRIVQKLKRYPKKRDDRFIEAEATSISVTLSITLFRLIAIPKHKSVACEKPFASLV